MSAKLGEVEDNRVCSITEMRHILDDSEELFRSIVKSAEEVRKLVKMIVKRSEEQAKNGQLLLKDRDDNAYEAGTRELLHIAFSNQQPLAFTLSHCRRCLEQVRNLFAKQLAVRAAQVLREPTNRCLDAGAAVMNAVARAFEE